MTRRFIFFFFLTCCTLRTAHAQTLKYWVFFSDKKLSKATDGVSQKTIENRKGLGLPLYHWTDIPVSKTYLNTIIKQGAKPVHCSKWLNAVSAMLTAKEARVIAQNDFVKHIEPINGYLQPAKNYFFETQSPTKYGLALSQMGVEILKSNSFTAKGIAIGVIDAGFYKADRNDFLRHLFENNKILAIRDFVNTDIPDYKRQFSPDDNHGTTVIEYIAGMYKNQQLGLATDASFYLARSEDGNKEFRAEEDYWIAAIEWMDSLGVRLVNTSLGYSNVFDDEKENYTKAQINGSTAHITRAAQIASEEKGMCIVVSAGNEGNQHDWRILTAPADAQGVFSVGATNRFGQKSSYSSIGVETLPYIKPNVSVFSLLGTSLAAPIITGLAACLMQEQPYISNKTLFSIIEKSSRLYPYGNNYVGYGTPNAELALKLLKDKSLNVSTHKQFVATKKNTYKITLESSDKAKKTQIVYFHKKDKLNVISQHRKKYNQNHTIKLKRPSSRVKYTTILCENSVWEIHWKGTFK